MAGACGDGGDADAADGGGVDDGPLAADSDPTPVATDDDCITDGSAGDHVFSCDGVEFNVVVDAACLETSCGVIVDVHGMTMTGPQMRLNTELDQLGPAQGYIVVHPNAPTQSPLPSWSAGDYPAVRDFIDRVLDVYDGDATRVHVTGFSQGGSMTWWFICNHPELLASAAPAAALGGCGDGAAMPELPILYMNGKQDPGQDVDQAGMMMQGLADDFGLQGPEVVGGETDLWERTRWGQGDSELSFLWHDFTVATPSGGHCIPGGTDTEGTGTLAPFNRTTCEDESELHWGQVALAWFVDHPQR